MANAKTFTSIHSRIMQKGDLSNIADDIIDNRELINEIVTRLGTEKSTLKFSYEKILRLLSEKTPRLIYPFFNDISILLDSENNFLKWGAIIMIANLASVDSENKIELIFGKYYEPVRGPVMITAANIIGSSWKIANAKPKLAERIAREILKIQSGIYVNHGEISHECKNIVIGHAIESFALFFDGIKNKHAVLEFVQSQLTNSRPSVRKKAEKFLRKAVRIS